MDYLFPQCISYVLILTKNGWVIFWATFSQTHLVTLVTSQYPLPCLHKEMAR
jgi:hypothetical protein